MIKLPKISSSQLFIMLLISRMFCMFTYKPQKLDLSFTAASIGIVLSVVINFIIFIPTLSVLKKYSGRNINDSLSFKKSGISKLFSILMLIVCLFLCVECTTQFEIFMTSTIYLTVSPIFFIIPIVTVCAYICRLGIETMGRMSGYVFGGLVISFVAITIAAAPKIDLKWIEPLGYDKITSFVRYVMDNVFYTTEIIPFMLLASYTKGNIKRGAIFFCIGAGVLFEIISLLVITTLGSYRETVIFPFYTVSAMAEATLSERFNAAYITLWIFMAAIRLCVYLFVSAKCIRQLKMFKNDTVPLIISSGIVVLTSVFTTQKISYINTMYSFIITGIPIIILAVIFPIALVLSIRFGRKNNEEK